MYAAIPKDIIAASVSDKGQVIGTGLGILDRDYVGIYAIHVSENTVDHKSGALSAIHC